VQRTLVQNFPLGLTCARYAFAPVAAASPDSACGGQVYTERKRLGHKGYVQVRTEQGLLLSVCIN